MRGTKAKRLRRKAESMSIGLPAAHYEMAQVLNLKGQVYKDRGMVVLTHCTRAVYHVLKGTDR